MNNVTRSFQNMVQENKQNQLVNHASETRRVQKYTNGSSCSEDIKVLKSVEQVLSKARPTFIVNLIQKGDELTKEDLEVIEAVQRNIEEEQKQSVKEEEVDSFVCSLSKCYISGCEVHTLLPTWIHYGCSNGCDTRKISSMEPRLRKGYECYKKHPGCSHVEVYQKHIAIVDYNGTTTVINE